MQTSFYSEEELLSLGFKSVGSNVMLSRKASLYSISDISIGNNVRIDDFCVLSGVITIGSYVHINAFTGIFASSAGVTLEDFTNISSRVTIYAISDDYSGETMTSPLVPEKYKNLRREHVRICKQTIIGTGCSILPGVTIGEGCAIGAMSLVKNDLAPWTIYAGTPCRQIRERSKKLLTLVPEFLEEQKLKM